MAESDVFEIEPGLKLNQAQIDALLPNKQHVRIVIWRGVGMTFKQLGESLNRSPSAVRQSYRSAIRTIKTNMNSELHATFPSRLANVLLMAGYDNVSDVGLDLKSGKLYPGSHRGYGQQSHMTLRKHFGHYLPDDDPARTCRYIRYLEDRGYAVTYESYAHQFS